MAKRKTTTKKAGKKATVKRSASSSAGVSRATSGSAKKKVAQKTVKSKASARRTAPSTSRPPQAAKKAAAAKAPKASAAKKTALPTAAGKSAPAGQELVEFSAPPKPVPKTKLKAKELGEFKAMLLAKRTELAGDVANLTDEALHRNGSGGPDSSTMPIHMADLGTDNWEQEFTLGLIASEEALVREIDDALDRIANKTYGVCLATHEPINMARLRAKPWAKYCIEYARLREEGRAP